MGDSTESVEGYVIDVACIRNHGRDELLQRAENHSKECALMGHCIESGYGIVSEEDRLTLLDPGATSKVVDTIEQSDTEEGIKLRVTKTEQDGKLVTMTVDEG